MLYVVYLVSIILYLIHGIGWDRVMHYIDGITLGFIAFPCLLILFCTRSFPAFGRAVRYAFGRREYSLSQCRESLRSVKMVMATAVTFGVADFLIGMINSIRTMDWSSLDSAGWICLDASVAMLSLFYPLLLCMAMLPVCFLLENAK